MNNLSLLQQIRGRHEKSGTSERREFLQGGGTPV